MVVVFTFAATPPIMKKASGKIMKFLIQWDWEKKQQKKKRQEPIIQKQSNHKEMENNGYPVAKLFQLLEVSFCFVVFVNKILFNLLNDILWCIFKRQNK